MRPQLVVAAASVMGFIASMIGLYEYAYSGSQICPEITVAVRVSCETVYSIPQAELLGVHFSLIAPLYFAVLASASLLNLAVSRRILTAAVLAIAIPGALLTPYLVYLEIVVAGALCLWCTVMHLSLIAVTAVSLKETLKRYNSGI